MALIAGGVAVAGWSFWNTAAFSEDTANNNSTPTDSTTASAPVAPPPAATQPAVAADEPLPSVPLTSTAAEVVKLAQAGMGEDVLLAYIGATKNHFSLGSDQIVYLNDVGISGTVVKAMIQRDAAMDAATSAALAAASVPVTIPDTNTPPAPPDDGSIPVGPPPTDANVPPMVDNAGDYSTPDDTAYFYDSLAPYGAWVYVAGAGLCWQPTVYVVDHTWRPYSDRGRWVYTDCGWYWQSDYSWGWAAFHYGRWFRDTQRGWVWAPDREWGPAWVSWRQSADYCGWAPLPPAAKFLPGVGFRVGNNVVAANYEFGLTAHRYIFIPIERMTDAAPARYSLLPTQSAELMQETKVSNNFKVENNRVVNHGVDPNRVAEVAGVEVRQAEIHDLPRTAGGKTPSDRMGRQDGKLVIYRPQLPKPDLNYVNKPKSTVASTGARPVTVIGNNAGTTMIMPVNRVPNSPATPSALRGPTLAAAAASSKVDNKLLVVYPVDLHNERPASAPLPAAAYPPYSSRWPGAQNNFAAPPPANYGVQLPPAPDYDAAADSTDPANDRYHSGDRRDWDNSRLGSGTRPTAGPMPLNNYPPQSFDSQSAILTPSHYNMNPAPVNAPASPRQASQYYHSDSSPPVNRAAPIYVPPAYSHTESAPAPPPVYHAPESHPVPVESHPAPAPAPSQSSSSSSSSNSGHK